MDDPKIIITPSTIQQEKPATVLLSEAAADDVEATVEAVAAVVSLKKDQQSPCSVESQDLIPPPSADLVVPSTDGKVKFVSCNIINLILSSLPYFWVPPGNGIFHNHYEIQKNISIMVVILKTTE